MAALMEGRHQHDAGSDHARANVKTCICCEHEKPFSEFFPSKFFVNGYTDTCRPCVIERAKAQRLEREEKKARAAATRKRKRAMRAKGPAPQPPPPPPNRPSKRKPKAPKPKETHNSRKRPPRKSTATAADVSPEPHPSSKACTCCGVTKPLEAFYPKGARHASRCKVCERRRKREEWAADVETARAKRRGRYWANVDKERARNAASMRSERGRQGNIIAVLAYQQRNPEKVAAWRAVSRAIRDGRLSVPSICQAAGCDRPADHKHHLSYHPARHDDVVPLCRHHHEQVHHCGAVRLKPTASHAFATSPRDHIPSSPTEQEGPTP